jgi:hypothetical protein
MTAYEERFSYQLIDSTRQNFKTHSWRGCGEKSKKDCSGRVFLLTHWLLLAIRFSILFPARKVGTLSRARSFIVSNIFCDKDG